MVGSAIAALEGVKEIADLVRKYNDLPLYEKIVGLQARVVELSSEQIELRSENETLREQLASRANTIFRNPYYYSDGDEVPLCPRCYETSDHRLRVHLTHPPCDMGGGFGRVCRNCKWFFKEGPRKLPRPVRLRARFGWNRP